LEPRLTLSQKDVQRLLQDPSPENRAATAGKVANQLDRELTAAERKIAHDVIGLMARDATVMVRAVLAENLKHIQDVPHDVAMRLAKDVEEVAMPLLESSGIFTDADLLEILATASVQKQEAIATRDVVSEQVSEVIVTTGGEKAVARLMSNEGAKLNEHSFDKALERFASSDAVKAPMVGRDKLPVTIAEKLVSIVSDQLKDVLVQKHELPAGVAADLIMQSRERATANLFDGATENDVEKLVLQLFNNSRLTPSLILRATCTGDVALFEWALATLSGVSITNARMLIHDSGPLGFKSIYEKAGMPRQLHAAFRVAVEVARETRYDGEDGDRERYRERMIQRILTQYEDMAAEDVDYLLGKLGNMAKAA
jgi:uncharacterized protein (DUF2336 family)